MDKNTEQTQDGLRQLIEQLEQGISQLHDKLEDLKNFIQDIQDKLDPMQDDLTDITALACPGSEPAAQPQEDEPESDADEADEADEAADGLPAELLEALGGAATALIIIKRALDK